MNKLEQASRPGHLKDGPLVLIQTEKTRRVLSRIAQRQGSMKKLQKVTLNWGKKK